MVRFKRSCTSLVSAAITAAGASVWLASPALAIVAHEEPAALSGLPGEVVVRPAVAVGQSIGADATLGSRLEILVDERSGAPRLLTAASFAAATDLAPDAALSVYLGTIKRFVEAAGAWIGAGTEDLALVEPSVLQNEEVQFFDFDVRRDGIVVADANVAFRFKQGRLLQVQTQTFAEAEADRRSEIEGLDRRVALAVSSERLQRGGELYRVVPSDNGYDLIRVVSYAVEIDGQMVDVQAVAATGAIFQAVSRHRFAAGTSSAMVYPRTWYGATLEAAPISEATLTAGGRKVQTAVDGTFAADATPRLSGFKGARADVRPTTGSLVQKDAVTRDGSFSLDFNDTVEKNLAQAMAYHHVNLMVRHAKRFIDTPWLDRPLRANVNLGQTCNAFWNGSTINFYSAGGSCANTALVADVVYHEWGHGLDANTGGIADSAYSEGFGDIMSVLFSRDPNMAPGFRTNGKGIRELETNKVYPRDRGEVHAEGLIIGGAFWDLYKSLRDKYDAEHAADLISDFALKTIFTARRYTDVYQALLVVDDDDGDLSNKTPNFCEVNAAFTAHGLATADASCN